MTLKLPKPLPYDYIDDYIDENFKFQYHVYKARAVGGNVEMGRWLAWPKRYNRTQVSRQMISMVSDIGRKEAQWLEDEYIYWRGGSGAMCWSAEEMTELEVDNYLHAYLGDGEVDLAFA